MDEPPWFCCPQYQPTKFILTNFLLPRSSLTEDKEWRMEKSSISCSQKTFGRNSPSMLSLAIAFRNSICIPYWQLKAEAWKYLIHTDSIQQQGSELLGSPFLLWESLLVLNWKKWYKNVQPWEQWEAVKGYRRDVKFIQKRPGQKYTLILPDVPLWYFTIG